MRNLFFLIVVCFCLKSSSQTQFWGLTSYGGKDDVGVIYRTDGTGQNQTVEYQFDKTVGQWPLHSDLLQASDGKLYGVTWSGGRNTGGVLFSLDPVTNEYSLKYDFSRNSDWGGNSPSGSLIQASNGKLYGLAQFKGANMNGTLFEFDIATATYTKKFDFGGAVNGGKPQGSLFQASDGNLYGMTSEGGADNAGVIFQYNPSTNVYTKKFDFDSLSSGYNATGSLIQGTDGKLYGLTPHNKGGGGYLFQYDFVNNIHTNKYTFGANGVVPYGSLIIASDGKFYGMTSAGGLNNYGVIFQYNSASNVYTKKIDFSTARGSMPEGSLVQATDGNLYGMTRSAGYGGNGTLFRYNTNTNTYSVTIEFSASSPNMGYHPNASLIQASNGKLYGMTYSGGLAQYGVIFQYDPTTDSYTKKKDLDHSLNGRNPNSALTAMPDGSLYGVAPLGGSLGGGVIFRFDPGTRAYVKKKELGSAQANNGFELVGRLILATDGNLYGMTKRGGTASYGTIFQYNPSTNTYTKKIDLDAAATGGFPASSLFQASDGKLYGMTEFFGGNSAGTLFQYDIITNTIIKKFDFNGVLSGSNPGGQLIQASDGMLYGLTKNGGTNNSGVLFQYDPVSSTYTKKIDFAGATNGKNPYTSLVQALDGKLYGVTISGGFNNSGVLFQYDIATNVISKKIDFDGILNGKIPSSDLLLASDGNLYGTTMGDYLTATDNGTLFQYNPFTETLTKTLDFTGVNGSGPRSLTEIGLKINSSISEYTYCQNDVIALNYNSFGGYNSGNVFTAQLSDAFGSFSSAVNIGSVTAISSGTINAVIPLSVTQGSLYRVRVISSSPAVTGNNNGTDIVIHGLPVITVNDGNVCEGEMFVLSPAGAASYTFSAGSATVSPISNSAYTVTGTDVNGCNGSSVSSVTVNAAPTLSVVSTGTVCEGSSITISVSGANAYLWSNGSITPTIAITPTITETFSVTGTDLNTCSTTQTISIILDNACADVWPGDANSDGIANNLDVLELGLHCTQTGPARIATSNNWQAYYANNWSSTITNGKNLNHSDCNGDGVINDNDTLAIFNNYGLNHAFKGNLQNVTNPQVSIVPDQSTVVKGTWGTASVYLGDVSNPMSNINGIAFTVNFDNTLIETNSVWIEYPASFINASNQNLNFRKLDFGNSNLYTATTHTVNNNVSGNGLIAKLHYQIKSTLSTDEILNLGIANASQGDASGVITPLTVGTTTVMAIGASVGITEATSSNIVSVSPNPANSSVLISSTTNLEKVELINLTGQVLMSEPVDAKIHRLNIENLANGVYFVKAYSSSKQIVLKKLLIQK